MDETSWAYQEECLNGRTDSISIPVFGYTVERLWIVVLQCSSADVAWKCTTLLSGKRKDRCIKDC